jgi:hypothetical protein
MSNKLILIAILLLGLITICFGALAYTTPYAAADAIVQVVRDSPPNDQFKVVEQMLSRQRSLFIIGPTTTGTAVALCSLSMLFRLWKNQPASKLL